MLHQLGNLILDVLDVVMIIFLNGCNRLENVLLLLRISQACEPLGLCGLLRLLLRQHYLRLSLESLISELVEVVSGVFNVRLLLILNLLLEHREAAAHGASGRGSEVVTRQALKRGGCLFLNSSSKEHILTIL